MIIRATKKVLSTNKIKPEVVDEKEVNTLNEWYVTLVSSGFAGKLFLVFVHHNSLLTVITEGKSIKQNFKSFKSRLNNLLQRSSFPTALINQLNNAVLNIDAITTTTNRGTVARLNQIVDQIKWRCNDAETYQDIDLIVEENLLLKQYFGYKKTIFTPARWWNNYILGNDPFDHFDDKNATIKQSKLNSDGLTQQEEWHMENQMLKMDLEQRFGKPIELNKSDDMPQIPVFIENEFLKHMSNFETQFKDAKETTIFDLLGKPKFKPFTEISAAKLRQETTRIFKLLSKNNIEIDFIASYSDETIYNFLTTELMEKTVPDISIPGFITHFIYEEFHPNHPILIEAAMHWLTGLIYNPDLNKHLIQQHLPQKEIVLNNQKYSVDEFKTAIKTFQITSDNLNVLNFSLSSLKIDDKIETALASGFIELKNELKGKRRIKKPITALFRNTDEFWLLDEVVFEDLN